MLNRKCLGWLIVFLAGLISGCAAKEAEEPGLPGMEDYLNGPIVEVLPELKNITKIEVYGMWDFVDEKSIAERFQLSEKYWPELFQAMKPARFDPDPAHWVMLCFMDVGLTQEKESTTENVVRIHVYYIHEGDGAFSIEKNEHERPYYRGGNSQALSRVLHKAYAERETQKTAK